MTADYLDLGVAAIVVLLVLDKVAQIIRYTRGRSGPQHMDLMRQLVDAVHVKNAVNVRLDHHDAEINRLRDAVHDMRKSMQELISRLHPPPP